MRRGFGAAGIAKRKDDDDKLGRIGQDLRDDRDDKISTALTALKDKLRNFSAKYRQQITSDPELCQQFLSVCTAIGLDPLVSDKSVWDGIFGGGRFLPEVSVQLLKELSMTRSENGGVMELADCVKKINIRRGGGKYANVTESDIARCVRELECLGEGVLWIEKINRVSFIFYAPDEIGPDSHFILGEMGATRKLSMSQILKFGWAQSRIDLALSQLIRDGIIWLDMPNTSSVFSNESLFFLAP